MPDATLPANSPPEPDLSNRQLGHFRLGRRLGRGGMADVYFAEQQLPRRPVALKVLHARLAQDDSYVQRFHNEAQAAASLVHANIVQIHEVGCVDGIHFIAQEYVDGQNLKQFVARRGPLDARQAVRVMVQVARALHKAAQSGIIHRDVKPENIMLTEIGDVKIEVAEVKVADFGLARLTNDATRVDLTQAGMTLGTPLYMSPEQVEGRDLDPRSDLYSFGITCYEMLTGRPPFEGDNAITVAIQHLKNDAPRLETVRKDLPGALCRIVHQLMAKKPDDRFQSAAEVLRELRQIDVEIEDLGSEDDATWDATDIDTHAIRRAATRKLSAAMRLQQAGRAWTTGLLVGVVIVVAFGVGCAAAWIARPTSLLDFNAASVPVVEKEESAAEQYAKAMIAGTERAYKAVELHFPPTDPVNAEYVRKARFQLADLYYKEGRHAESLALLDHLVIDDTSALSQLNARVLQINVAARERHRNVNAMIGELAKSLPKNNTAVQEVRQRLESPDSRRVLDELLQAGKESRGNEK